MTDTYATIERFYSAFARRDHATMAACYTHSAHFSDPVFRTLVGAEIGMMWRMLCERGTDLQIQYGPIREEGQRLVVDWEARYTYRATGRPVHNKITASLFLEGGLIQDHVDDFDFYRWARQALGVSGLLFGWNSRMQRTVQRRAKLALAAFSAKALERGA